MNQLSLVGKDITKQRGISSYINSITLCIVRSTPGCEIQYRISTKTAEVVQKKEQ